MSVLIVQASVVMEPAGIGSEDSSVCVVQGLNQGQTTHAKVSKDSVKNEEACSKNISSSKNSIYLLQILMSAVGHRTIVLSGA